MLLFLETTWDRLGIVVVILVVYFYLRFSPNGNIFNTFNKISEMEVIYMLLLTMVGVLWCFNLYTMISHYFISFHWTFYFSWEIGSGRFKWLAQSHRWISQKARTRTWISLLKEIALREGPEIWLFFGSSVGFNLKAVPWGRVLEHLGCQIGCLSLYLFFSLECYLMNCFVYSQWLWLWDVFEIILQLFGYI